MLCPSRHNAVVYRCFVPLFATAKSHRFEVLCNLFPFSIRRRHNAIVSRTTVVLPLFQLDQHRYIFNGKPTVTWNIQIAHQRKVSTTLTHLRIIKLHTTKTLQKEPTMSKDTQHTSMSFEILPATPHDISEIAKTWYQSFYQNAPHVRSIPTDELIADLILELVQNFDDRWIEIFKAVNTSTSAIVGFSIFEFPEKGETPLSEAEHSLRPHAQSLFAKGEIPPWAPEEKFDPFANSRLPSPSYDKDEVNDEEDDLISELGAEALGRCYDYNEDFFVRYLAVTPCYRRLGLGERLMRAVLNIADERGAKVCLSPTTMGQPLYLKLGFKVVEEVETERYTETYMVREPENKSEVPAQSSAETGKKN